MAERQLVLDNGSGHIKIGFADWETPKSVPNLMCKDRRGRTCYISSQLYDAPDCSNLSYRRPFEKGYFVDPATECDIWKYVLGAELGLTTDDLRSTQLLLTAPYFTPRKLQREYNELVFEYFEFQELACVSPAFLTMVTHFARRRAVPCAEWPFAHAAPDAGPKGAKRKREEVKLEEAAPPVEPPPPVPTHHPCTCIVVDAGYSFSHVVPFVGGRAVKSAVKRVPMGSKVMVNHMKGILSFRQFDMTDEDWLVGTLLHKLCFVSTDFERDMRICSGHWTKNHIRARYMLPSGQPGSPPLGEVVADGIQLTAADQVLMLNSERFSVPELLFHPSDVGFPHMGLAEAVVASITTPDIHPDLRPLLLDNVVLAGGCSMFPGFEARMQAELTALCNDDLSQARCVRDADSHFSAFNGGCDVFRSGSYSALSVSRQQYNEGEGGKTLCRSRIWGDFP
uniref:Actin-related protein 6 n=1 Tax=Eutreptiella gymnastica TaxID=73025 RepID=A0A7S1IUI4_9EUGL|mmetsp:Transcript_4363/g.7644  ORF Transcript_4363/g.7644 Transcript_4363/m.7644 type:complete len:452 (+) Transcript_4363:51-1406(+)